MLLLTGAAAFAAAHAAAQTPPAPFQSGSGAENITVVGTSPLLGSGLSRNLVPAETQVLTSTDLARNGAADVLNALNTEVAGVNLDSASGNAFQPSIFYNGFEVSPLQGTPQGLAVYLNGVRFNQAFGDTVNWDLIPDIAIGRINVEGSNPVFGLNALGGSFNIALKDGFTTHVGEATLSGGAFGQVQGELQYGIQSGNQALYVAGSVIHQGGWRDDQSTDIQNLFADYGIKSEKTEIHLDLLTANSAINGPGTAPVQLLAADPAAQFTSPNALANRFLQTSLRGNYRFSDTLSVQAQAYYSYYLQRIANGNTANDAPCNNGSNLLCQSPGVPSTTLGGGAIPAYFGNNAEYSQLDQQTTNTNAYGATLQATDTGSVAGLQNHFVTGLSYDGAQTEFSAHGLIGGLNPITRAYVGPGYVLDEPGTNSPVRVAITDSYAGAYASDTLNLTDALAVTLSGRFNFAEINLKDQNGGDLTGNHAYARFNPAFGATYRFTAWLTGYAGYAEANRAPTPAELSCAGPQNSCSLANFFTGDPDLKQVVAHSIEAGLRGRFTLPDASRLTYDVGLFRTTSDDDIAFINSVTLSRAYFANIGQTRRQGLSARLDYKRNWLTAYVDYSYVEAAYQNGYVESAGSNPAADASGNITVRRGNALPGVPRDTLKFGLDVDITPRLHVGGDGQLQSGQYLFGDEANLNPKLPGFFVMDLRASYDVTPRLSVFVSGANVLDRRYYTYGTFSPTSAVYLVQAPGASNPRSYAVAAPIGWFGGVKIKF
jgi:iron complex outermembrane receptor protein